MASLSQSVLAHDYLVAPIFLVAHCCSPMTVEWRRVWDTHTLPSSFKPDVLARRLGKIGSPQAAHLSQFVLTVAQKPSPTAASRRPPAHQKNCTSHIVRSTLDHPDKD